MSEQNDSYWDDLGVNWAAIDPDIGIITPRLEARLRRQSNWITAGLVSAWMVSACGLVLGLVTMWTGWQSGAWHFVTRGFGITVVSLLLAGSARWLRPVRSAEQAVALSEMLDLAIQRAMRMVLLIRLSLWACGLAAASGLVGTAIRTHLSDPPRMSPIVDLILLGLFAMVLYLCGRQCDASVARYELLKHSLVGKDGVG